MVENKGEKAGKMKMTSILKTPKRDRLQTQKSTAPGDGKHDSVQSALGRWRQKSMKSTQNLVVEQNSHSPITLNLEKLTIRPEHLQIVRDKAQGHGHITSRIPITKDVLVRRRKEKDNQITYAVMKSAPEDYVIPEPEINYAGPQFDKAGKFIPHSILGSLEMFKDEADRRGEYQELFKNDEKQKLRHYQQKSEVKKCSALAQWETRINDWNTLHEKMSKRLKRPVSDLLMRTPNEYPQVIRQRRLASRALEATSSGHGSKRTNAVFFKQCDQAGEDLSAIYSTLQNSEVNDMFPVENRGIPNIIQKEKGSDAANIARSYRPHYTDYLDTQRKQTECFIRVLNPHSPLFDDLQVVGLPLKQDCIDEDKRSQSGKITVQNPHLLHYLDVNPVKETQGDTKGNTKIYFDRPAIRIKDQLAKWQGQGQSRQGETEVDVSVLFDGNVGENIHQTLTIENVGSTLLHYEWNKAPAYISYDIPRQRKQRFYFLTEGGTLAPGDVFNLSILCKSSNAGIFQESWKISTTPVVCQGANLIVTFKAIIHSTENYWEDFASIEERMRHNRTFRVVDDIVNTLVDSICAPEPPPSPIVQYTSPEVQFENQNPGLFHHCSTVRSMENLHTLLTESLPQISEDCTSFSVDSLRNVVIRMTDLEQSSELDVSPLTSEMDEDWEYTKRRLLWRYLRQTINLSFPRPLAEIPHSLLCCYTSYNILQITIDEFADFATRIAGVMDLPLRVEEEEEPIEKIVEKKKGGKKASIVPTKSKRGKESEKNRVSPPQRGKTPSATPSSTTRSGRKSHTPSKMIGDDGTPEDPILESFCPVVKYKTSPQKYQIFKEKLNLYMYELLETAIIKIVDVMESHEKEAMTMETYLNRHN